MKRCIHCGYELPDDTSFCPRCAVSQFEPEPVAPYRPRKIRRGIVLGLILLLVAALAAGLALRQRPRVYEADGPELVYTDADGSYRIFLTWSAGTGTQTKAMREFSVTMPEGLESAHPSLLFVYDTAAEKNLQAEFMDKVADVRVTAHPRENAEAMTIQGPIYNDAFPYAMLAADVIYTVENGANDIVWELSMKNGDRITLTHSYTVNRLRTLVFTPEDTPLETMDDLKALMQRIESSDDAGARVIIYLPPNTYEGGLDFTERAYELMGSARDGRTTTFTGGFKIASRAPMYSQLSGIVLEGSGGIGILASEAVALNDCELRGWDVACYAREGSWIGLHGCLLEQNGIGLQFDSEHTSMADDMYEHNRFLNNGTAVSLLRVPGDISLNFPESTFSGNEEDILNSSGAKVNTQDATFS